MKKNYVRAILRMDCCSGGLLWCSHSGVCCDPSQTPASQTPEWLTQPCMLLSLVAKQFIMMMLLMQWLQKKQLGKFTKHLLLATGWYSNLHELVASTPRLQTGSDGMNIYILRHLVQRILLNSNCWCHCGCHFRLCCFGWLLINSWQEPSVAMLAAKYGLVQPHHLPAGGIAANWQQQSISA